VGLHAGCIHIEIKVLKNEVWLGEVI